MGTRDTMACGGGENPWDDRLQEEYISETCNYFNVVNNFCDKEPEWIDKREKNLEKMRSIKRSSEEFMAGFKLQELKDDLSKVLNDTREGLQTLQTFLDAVEMLAVTSPSMFPDEGFLQEGVSAVEVRSVISTARKVSPFLVSFKRDAKGFFQPVINNIDILIFQLHKYTCITKWLCKQLRSKNISKVTVPQDEPLATVCSTHESEKRVTEHWRQLSKIRTDESFRLAFLLNGQQFMDINDQEMFQLLSGLEEKADQLDMIKSVCRVFTIIACIIGIIGGIFSIRGQCIFPAENSLSLTKTGGILGATSGIISLLTGLMGFLGNKCCIPKAKENINKIAGKMQTVVDCLEQAASGQRPITQLDQGSIELGAMLMNFHRIVKSIDVTVDTASALEQLDLTKMKSYIFLGINGVSLLFDFGVLLKRTSELCRLICSSPALKYFLMKARQKICDFLCKVKEGEMSQLVPSGQTLKKLVWKIWQNICDFLCKVKESIVYLLTHVCSAVKHVVVKTCQKVCAFTCEVKNCKRSKLSSTLKHLGMNVWQFLCEGTENQVSQIIRCRLNLWRSEMDAWQKTCDLMCKGKMEFEANMETLKREREGVNISNII